MTCLTEGQLNDYVSGRLSTQERWELRRHLEACPDCQQQADELRVAGRWLDLLGEAEGANQHVKPEILAALAEGTLDSASRAQALAHVGTCGECATVLGTLRRGLIAEADMGEVAAAEPGPVEKPRRRLASWSALAAAAAAFVVVGSIMLTQLADRGAMAPVPVARSEQALDTSTPATDATGGGPRSEGAAMAPSPGGDKPLQAPSKARPTRVTTGAEEVRAAEAGRRPTGRAVGSDRAGSGLRGRALAKALTEPGAGAARVSVGGVAQPGGRPTAVVPLTGRGGRPGVPELPKGPRAPGGMEMMAAPGLGGMGGGPVTGVGRSELPGPHGVDGVGAAAMPEGVAAVAATGRASANNQVTRRLPPANQVQRREPTPEKAHPAEAARGDEADRAEVSQQATVHAQPLRNQKAQIKPEEP
ncbi:MAG: hypothetical protein HPY69_14380 [Armatimonadetes bacterium]|nr:hypothetical protein [Armatimonadota bacterium]